MKKALIVYGGWSGHTPQESAAVIAGMLGEAGFGVDIATSTAAFADPAIHDLSLIVPIFTMAAITAQEATNLCAAVEGGVGIAGFHGGMCDAFRDSVDYQFMTGGQWVAHPGDIIDFHVNVVDPGDPVMAGITDFPFRSEQYYMHVDPANKVLASTVFSGDHCPWIKGVVMPVVWKRRHGAGRVFFSALGHTAAEFDDPNCAAIQRRGMLWAAR